MVGPPLVKIKAALHADRLRIIYRDGTVNSFVQRYLREKVLKLFAAKPKAPGRKKA